jgi:uncharacterized protein
MLAALPAYFYSTSDEGLWVHLYASGSVTAAAGGEAVALRQETRYPWDGEVRLTVEAAPAAPLSLFLRVPGWCEGASVAVNGELAADAAPGSYAELRRAWRPGDEVRLSLPMPVRRVESHPYVAGNTGRAALMRGPLVYCIEQADLGGVGPQDVVLAPENELAVSWEPELLGGVIVLRGAAVARDHAAAWDGQLYAPLPAHEHPDTSSSTTSSSSSTIPEHPNTRTPEHLIPLTAVPYFAWANREPGGMAVWIRTR